MMNGDCHNSNDRIVGRRGGNGSGCWGRRFRNRRATRATMAVAFRSWVDDPNPVFSVTFNGRTIKFMIFGLGTNIFIKFGYIVDAIPTLFVGAITRHLVGQLANADGLAHFRWRHL